MTFLIIAYTLWCAWRDRKATRLRRFPVSSNPYSLADLLRKNYETSIQRSNYGYASIGQLYSSNVYSGTTNANIITYRSVP